MSHWYAQLSDGTVEARHTVPMTKDPTQTRNTRITDVRKWIKNGEKVAPSVTTIQNVLHKEALMNWQKEQLNKASYKLNPADYLNFTEYNAAVNKAFKEEADKAPQAGIDFHALMEAFINKELAIEHESFDLCREVCNLIFDKTGVPMDEWQSEIKVFSILGYSGQCDLFIPGERPYVIDFKTKQFADKFNPGKMGFPKSHLSQLMAYGAELDPSFLFTPVNIFVCLETGEIDWHQWDNEKQKTKAFNYFLAALNVFNVDNEL